MGVENKVGKIFKGYKFVKSIDCREGFGYEAINEDHKSFIRLFEDEKSLKHFLHTKELGVFENIKNLPDHKNRAKLLDYGEEDYLGYLILDFIDGDLLIDKVDDYSETDSIKLVSEISDGLIDFHNLVIHCDIWEKNIIVDSKGNPVIIDYELAVPNRDYDSEDSRLMDEDYNKNYKIVANKVHTPSWMKTRYDDACNQSDLFSLTSILYKSIFKKTLNEFGYNFPKPSQNLGSEYNVLDKIFMKGLAEKGKSDAYKNAKIFGAELLKAREIILENLKNSPVDDISIKYRKGVQERYEKIQKSFGNMDQDIVFKVPTSKEVKTLCIKLVDLGEFIINNGLKNDPEAIQKRDDVYKNANMLMKTTYDSIFEQTKRDFDEHSSEKNVDLPIEIKKRYTNAKQIKNAWDNAPPEVRAINMDRYYYKKLI